MEWVTVEIRVNKYLSEIGYCSRREADRLLEAGRVKCAKRTLFVGDKIEDGTVLYVDNKEINRQEKKVYLAFNKPIGVECTCDCRVANNVISYIHYPIRLMYMGRLDKNSEGLLLLTNEGTQINKLMRAGNYHEKEYEVCVDKPITDGFIHDMQMGVPILNTITRPCQVERTGEKSFRIILTQGLNRQIRRMCSHFEYRVVSLKRTRIMSILLGELKTGEYRELTDMEIEGLKEQSKNSYNHFGDTIATEEGDKFDE